MAQKKVILKDGQDELMPKTLASMVFTQDGTSVEAALENIGGGGSGGTGNVKVTNASSLGKDYYYAFKPSADRSVEGTFSTIPVATASNAGLMSSLNYEKLGNIKPIFHISIALASLTNNSTSEEILQAFDVISSQPNALLYLMLLYSNAEVIEYDADYAQAFIGNFPAVMRCTYDSEAFSGTMELTYVAAGGKLRTITISGKQGGTSPDLTYTYSCAVTESGDDAYYLPLGIVNLESGAQKAEIDSAFGGEGKFLEALNAAANKKKLYIYTVLVGTIPVGSISLFGLSGFLSFLYVVPASGIVKIYSISGSSVKVIYPQGYSLKAAVYLLTTSSNTDTISTAVGGESGLKEIIQAVKDGNRLVIRGTLDSLPGSAINQDVQCNMYQEAENGDMALLLSGKGYGLWNATGGILNITYTKSSNTFACYVSTD